MNIKKISTVFTKPSVLAPTVFLAVGTGKTVLDYNNSSPQKKKRTLAKDTAILLGSAAGFMLVRPLSQAICRHGSLNGTILKNTEYVISQSVAATINTLAGIAGAVAGNRLAYRYILNKPYFSVKSEDKSKESYTAFRLNNKVFSKFDYVNKPAVETANAILSLPNMNYFYAPMVALTGMSVAKTQGNNNQIKRTAKEVIANTLIPTFLVSAVSLFVHNKKNYVKYPALLAALAAGSYGGNKIAEKYEDKLDETISSVNFKGLNFKKSDKTVKA